MRMIQVREFVKKYGIPEVGTRYHKILLLSSLLLVFIMDAIVISQRQLHLSEGVSSTWWMIVQNMESGAGYKGCDTHYVPNCEGTDQTTAMREPIPVFFYVLVGKLTQNAPLAFQFSQLILNLLICFFMYLLTSELGTPSLGLIAAYSWAFYLPAFHTVMHISGDLMAGFFVLAGILSLTRAIRNGSFKSWLLFGVLFGLAVLSRSSTVLIFIILAVGSALYVWLSATLRHGWYRPLLAIIVFGFAVSPWVIRNQIVFGKPILGTTLVGYNLYRFNAIAASEVPPHFVGPDEGYAEVEALVARVPELRRPISEGKVDAIFEREALKIIRNHLEEYIELVAFRPFPLWFNLGITDQYGEQMMLTDYLIVIQQGILLVTFMMAIWKGDRYIRFLAASVLFFMLGYLAVDAQLRYMIVVMPLVISISVIGIAGYIRTQIRHKQPQKYSGIIPRYE